jgi:hypothetical protein
VSVTDDAHVEGSTAPSTHVRNDTVDPDTRNRTHCRPVPTTRAPDTLANVDIVPATLRRNATVEEFDENSSPYPFTGRYAFCQPPDPRVHTEKYATAAASENRYENTVSDPDRAARPDNDARPNDPADDEIPS